MSRQDTLPYRVGAARVLFDPPVGLPMAGYAARTAGAQGVHDPLYVRAVIVSDDRQTLCLFSVDVLCLDAGLVAEIRSDIAARLSLEPTAIMIAATHTHSGPAGLLRFSQLPGAEQYLSVYDPALARQLRACCVEAAVAAAAARVPARAVTGTGSARGVAGNRLDPNGVVDPDVPWLAFADAAGAVRACILSFPCHPTVLGSDNRLYSADLSGALCRALEAFHNVERALCLTGAAGNVSTRFTRGEASFAEVNRLAARVINTFDFDGASIDEQAVCAAASTTVTLALKPRDSDAIQERLNEVERLLNAGGDFEGRAVLQAEKMGLELALQPPVSAASQTLTTELQILRIGRSLIVGFPGEMFVEYGLVLRERLPNDHVLIAGYANDYIGYVPTPETSSGYEAAMAIVASVAGEHLLQGALRLAQSMLVKF